MDMTEHPTRTGEVYLAVVLDAWSRRIVGWSIAAHMRADVVVDPITHGIVAATATSRPNGCTFGPRVAIHLSGLRTTTPGRRDPRINGLDR